MRQMKFWLKSLTVTGLTSTIVPNVVACADDGIQEGLPLTIANALGFTTNDIPNAKLVIDQDNNWKIDLSTISLANLLTTNASEAPAKPGCEDFIKNVLNIQPESLGSYSREKLTSLDKFTTIDSINPIIALNDSSNDYNLISGTFTIQFKKDNRTNLGNEYLVVLKTISNFINNLLSNSFNNTPLVLDDFNIDKSKFKVNKPTTELNLKVGNQITLNKTANAKKLNAIATLLDQNLGFTIAKITNSTNTWASGDSIQLDIIFNGIKIDNFNITLAPSV